MIIQPSTKNNSFFFKENRSSLAIFFILFFFGLTITIMGFINEYGSQWLFISPALTATTVLSWVNSTWIGVLAIHGTLVALTISFIGMIINQISDSVEESYHSVNRKIILRNFNFSSFSLNSVLYLIYGIFFYSFGGGLIVYFISIIASLLFFLNYLRIYHSLYKVIENNEQAGLIMLSEIKLCTKLLDDEVAEPYLITREFLEINNKFNNIVPIRAITSSTPGATYETISFDENKKISKLNINKFKKLSNEIKKIDDTTSVSIMIDHFHKGSEIKITYSLIGNKSISDKKLSRLIVSCFEIKEKPEFYKYHKILLSSTFRSIYSSMISSKDLFTQFSLDSFIALSTERNISDNISKLEDFFYKQNKTKQLNVFILRDFFKKFVNSVVKSSYNDNGKAFSFMLNYPYDRLEKEDFKTYLHQLNTSFGYHVTTSRNNETNLGKYLSWLAKMITRRDYEFFLIASKHFTIKRFGFSIPANRKIKASHHMLIMAMKCYFSLLLNRLDYISSNYNDEDEMENEKKEIIKCIKAWSHPEAINGIYYIEETYANLFSPHLDYVTPFDDINIRERESGISYISEVYSFADYAVALILILNNKLNPSSQCAKDITSEDSAGDTILFLNSVKSKLHEDFLEKIALDIITNKEDVQFRVRKREKVIDSVVAKIG